MPLRIIQSALIFSIASLFSCNPPPSQSGIDDQIVAFASIAPVQYFIDQIAGDRVSTEVMVRPGFSPATYDPLPSQMTELSQARIFFMVGHLGYEDAWRRKLAEMYTSMEIIDLSGGVSFLEGGHVHHDGESVDPHIWLAPAEVRIMINNISQALIQIDSSNRQTYTVNTVALLARVDSLEQSLNRRLADKNGSRFYIFHPALGYLARQYNLEQISLEHEGKEPTPKMLESLLQSLKKEQNPVILVQREFDQKHAEVLARESHARIVEISPLEYDWFQMMDKLVEAIE